MVTIHPIIAGPHQLRVQIAGADIYGSPFTLPVLSSAETRKRMLKGFFKGLENPCGVAVTADGKYVVVAECSRHCVTVLTDTGELVRRFGSFGSGPGKFLNPWGVAVSADNHIFVVDTQLNGTFQKFTLTGRHVASVRLSGFGLAVHQDGRIYSINSEACKVDVYHPDLTHFHSFGNKSCFAKPCDVAIDTRGMVYVTDCYKCEILKLTSEGEYLTSIGSGGTRPEQFAWPLRICIDSNDIMYVTDKHQVIMFTTEGKFLGSFGGTGRQDFQPRGVAVDKTGNFYVCDVSNGEVLVSRLL